MSVSLVDNVSSTQLVRASEDRVLRHHVLVNVVSDGMIP